MSAIMSADQKFRFVLERDLEDPQPIISKTIMFCMLNPSTADAVADDPTITRCMDFAKRFGANKLIVVHLYPFRATDPKDLLAAFSKGVDVAQWERNSAHVFEAATMASMGCVCAWGTNAPAGTGWRMWYVLKSASAEIWCLGTNKDGSPKHPLYLKRETSLQRWKP